MSDALRKLIRELVEQELEETTSSGAAGPYNTPFAFRGNGADGKAKAKKNAENSGNVLVDKTAEKADEAGEQSVETVPFGEKGAGALKKPKAEPKPKIEEDVKSDLRDKIKNKEDRIAALKDKLSNNKGSIEIRKQRTATLKSAEEDLASLKNQLSLKENRYNEFKMSEGTPSQKIGKAIREINRQISEVDRVLSMNERLKQESGTSGEQLWKSTARGFTKLESRLNTLSARIRNLRA